MPSRSLRRPATSSDGYPPAALKTFDGGGGFVGPNGVLLSQSSGEKES